MKRIHLIINGKVQGVFYRDNTKKKASELGLKGFVKNIENGLVEIIAEGPEDKLSELIEFCKNNPGYSEVDRLDIKKEKATNEFIGFKVKY
ncbi:acylphosphatase [Candidatus Woesearchaeota archaeon]|nr:acylphosphatase [Candidatus Woesearchaeota archaeon]